MMKPVPITVSEAGHATPEILLAEVETLVDHFGAQ